MAGISDDSLSSKQEETKLPHESDNEITARQGVVPVGGKTEPIKGSPYSAEVSPHIYPIDAGIIRCICGFDDDDGFTIQCEKCNAWQHAQCVDIADEQHVPDIYYCEICSNSREKYNVERARQRQLMRIQRSVENREDDDESSQPQEQDQPSLPLPRKRSRGTGIGINTEIGSGNSSNNLYTDEIGNPRKRKPKRTKSGTTTRSASPGDESPTGSSTVPLERKSSDRADSDSSKTRREARGTRGVANVSSVVPGAGPGRKRKRMTVENNKKAGQADNHEIEAKYTHAQSYLSHVVKQPDCRIGNSQVKDYLLSIADQVEECPRNRQRSTSAVNGSIAGAKITVQTTNEQQGKQRFSGFPGFGVYASHDIKANDLIFKATGKLLLQEQYKTNTINQYRLFGCPKPGTLFTEDFDIALDGRCVGNEATFLRRSCHPNVKVRLVKAEDQGKESPLEFEVAIVAGNEPISVGAELCVDWEWDQDHPIRLVSSDNNKVSELTENDKNVLWQTFKALETRDFDCRCEDTSKCQVAIARHYIEQFHPSEKSKRRGTGSFAVSGLGTGTDPNSVSSKNMASIGSYSAREERKLKETLLLIDKLERRTKSESHVQVDPTTIPTAATTIPAVINEEERAIAVPAPAPAPAPITVPTLAPEPISPQASPDVSIQEVSTNNLLIKRQGEFSSLLPRARRLLREYRTHSRRDEPLKACALSRRSLPSKALISLGMAVSVAIYESPDRHPLSATSTSPSSSAHVSPQFVERKLPDDALESVASETTRTAAEERNDSQATTIFAEKTANVESTSSPPPPLPAPPPSQVPAAAPANKAVKRLTFADYKKKQRPSVSGT